MKPNLILIKNLIFLQLKKIFLIHKESFLALKRLRFERKSFLDFAGAKGVFSLLIVFLIFNFIYYVFNFSLFFVPCFVSFFLYHFKVIYELVKEDSEANFFNFYFKNRVNYNIEITAILYGLSVSFYFLLTLFMVIL